MKAIDLLNITQLEVSNLMDDIDRLYGKINHYNGQLKTNNTKVDFSHITKQLESVKEVADEVAKSFYKIKTGDINNNTSIEHIKKALDDVTSMFKDTERLAKVAMSNVKDIDSLLYDAGNMRDVTASLEGTIDKEVKGIKKLTTKMISDYKEQLSELTVKLIKITEEQLGTNVLDSYGINGKYKNTETMKQFSINMQNEWSDENKLWTKIKESKVLVNTFKKYSELHSRVNNPNYITEVKRFQTANWGEQINKSSNEIEKLAAIFKTIPSVADAIMNNDIEVLNKYKELRLKHDGDLGKVAAEMNGSIEKTTEKLNESLDKAKELNKEINNVDVNTGDTGNVDKVKSKHEDVAKTIDKATKSNVSNLENQKQAEQKLASGTETSERKRADATKQASDKIRQAHKQIRDTLQSAFTFVNQAVNKIVSIIRTAVNLIIKSVTAIGKTLTGLKNIVTRIISLFGNLGNRVRGLFSGATEGSYNTNKSFNILKGTATELRSKILLLKGAFNSIFNNSLNKQAMTLYQSVYSLKNITGASLTQDTIDWANSMERAFGISAKELISDLNELSGVLHGLGMRAEHVAVGSQNILMISRYLAFMGAAGGDVNAVMNKLNSGMKGMTQSIDDLGLSVREAEMNSYLKKLKAQGGEFANIGTSFANLNEEARVYIRYASLISQFTSKYNMEDLAKTFDTVTGRLSILNQRIRNLGTTIGQVFIKLASAIAPYVTYIVSVIEQGVYRIASLIGSLTGIDMSIEMSQGMNDSTNAADQLTGSLGNVEDELKKVEEQSKKTNNSLFGSDSRLNVYNTKTDSGESGDDFDYSKLMTSALDGLNELAKEANATYLDKLKNKFNTRLSEIKQSIDKFIKDITGRPDFDIGFDTDKFKSSLKEMTEYTGKFIKNTASLIAEFTLKIADDINIGNIVIKITELFAQLAKTINTIVEVSTPGLRKFYDIALKPIIEGLGIILADRIQFLNDKLNELGNWFTSNQETVTNWFVNLANKFNELKGMLASAITGKGFELVDENTTGILNQVLNIIRSLSEVGKKLLTDVIKPLLQSFGEFAKNELIPWLAEKMKELSDWVNANSDKIVEFIKYVANEIWKLVKLITEKLVPVVGWIIEHPKAIKAALVGLMGLKIISWIGNLALGVWKAVEAFQGLKGAIGAISGAKGAGGLLSGAKTAIGGAGKALAGAAPMLAGVAGLGMGVVDAVKSVNRTEEILGDNKFTSKITAGLSGFIGGQGRGVTDENRTTGQKVGGVLGNTAKWAGMGAAVGSIIPGVGTAVGAAVGGAGGLIGGLIGGDNIANMIKSTQTFIKDQIKKIPETVKTVTSTVGTTFQNIATKAQDGFTNITTNALENFKSVGTTALEVFNGLGTKAFEVFSNLSNKFFETVSKIITGALKSFNTITSRISETLSNVVKNIMNTFSSIGTTALNAFNNIATSVLNTFSNISSKVFETFSNIANNVVNMFSNIADNVAKTLRTIIDKIVNVFSDIRNTAFNFIKDTASNFVESGKTKVKSAASKFGITNVPFLASGGTVRSGQLFVANENGKSELIGDFGLGGTSVANGDQIMEAMKTGIFEAVYNAMAEIYGQGFGNKDAIRDIILNLNGLNMVDKHSIKKIVRDVLMPEIKANNNGKVYGY